MKKVMSIVLVCVILIFSGCSPHEGAGNISSDSSADSSSESSVLSESTGDSSSDITVSSESSGSSEDPTSAPVEYTVAPPFFKITDPQTGGVAYLLGTMHVGVEDTVYPSEIYAALDESSALAVELDLQTLDTDMTRLVNAMSVLVLKDGTTTRDYLGEDYDKVLAYFQENQIYVFGMHLYIPTMWSSILSNKVADDCGYSSEYGTDRAMLTYAKEHSKEIVELETAEEQYRVLASEPMSLQVYSLVSSVEADYEELMDQMKELYRAWSTNDSAAFESMVNDEIPEGFEDDYAEYSYEMYEGRQKRMAEYIENALSNGEKVFVAVGAMHCYATPDILDFLDGKAVIEQVKFGS